ncbi:hypothetical protein DFP72DRAFT_1165600 [Ephemerocybe angulata]|uniref:Uncharacterized protein n=1 Tax=Ephemerocybe angulata TaxID=980116 RepID=A0A8H6IB27_9AGAR|nr:hypothetical protein DFP72DRAFT_1165600 [Tulosesus angulatus]
MSAPDLVSLWQLFCTSLQQGIGLLLPLCAVYTLYRLDRDVRDVNKLRETIIALNSDIMKRDGDMVALRAELEKKGTKISDMDREVARKDESISTLMKEKAETDETMLTMKAEVVEKAKTIRQLDEEIKKKGELNWILQGKGQELERRLWDAWNSAKREKETMDEQAVIKDQEIAELTLDVMILREKLTECIGRIEALQDQGGKIALRKPGHSVKRVGRVVLEPPAHEPDPTSQSTHSAPGASRSSPPSYSEPLPTHRR